MTRVRMIGFTDGSVIAFRLVTRAMLALRTPTLTARTALVPAFAARPWSVFKATVAVEVNVSQLARQLVYSFLESLAPGSSS
jgi:hypothetical protein